MKAEIPKCGEIFRCGPGKFIFSCAYCSVEFNLKSNALAHIETHFLLKDQSLGGGIIKNEQIDQFHGSDSLIDVQIGVVEKFGTPLISDDEKSLLPKVEFEEPFLDISEAPSNYFDEIEDDTVIVEDERTFIKPSKRDVKPKTARFPMLSRWGPSDTSKSIVECDICSSRMKKRSIVPHLQSHANLKQYVCALCQRAYNTQQQLKKHSKIHSTFKKFSCDYCGWQFHDRTNLIRHIRKHTGEKPYKCKICEKSFAQSNSVIVHMRSHTGEKPFQCTICNRAFNAQNMVQRHLRRHAMEKTFKCNSCDRSFYSGTALRDHRRSQHTGERPYICSVCRNTFSRRSAYRQHIILHTGQKPYKCRFCEMTFAQGAGLRSHERSVHKDIDRMVVEDKINGTTTVLSSGATL